jgi:hypothetical protein
MVTNSPAVIGSNPRRERGFLVVVRNSAQLQALQALCLSPDFTSVSCLTARYRVRPGPAIGTVIGAFAGDLQRMRSGDWTPGDAAGDLLPPPGPVPADSPWARLARLASLDTLFELASPAAIEDGELGPSWQTSFVSALASHDALPPGSRLIVFVEIDPVAANASEWAEVIPSVLRLLPKRVGIVVSGAPSGLRRPRGISADDPHVAIVTDDDLPPSQVAPDSTYTYSDSPLSGDQPADDDLLAVDHYADGLARLVLHKDTKPLTIGIHGPWGSGKSSFMQLIKNALYRHAPANTQNGLRFALDSVKDTLETNQPEHWGNEPPHAWASDILVDAENHRREFLQRMRVEARRDVITIDFNAWQYNSETQIWAGLASEITHALEGAMPWYRRLTLPIRYALGRRTNEVILSLVVPVIAAVAVLVVLSRIALSEAAGTKILGDLAVFSSLVPGGALVLLVALWRTAVLAVPVSRRILGYARGPDYSDQMGFQSQVISDLAFVSQQLQPPALPRLRLPRIRDRRAIETSRLPLPKARRPPPRVVVFIDDLDRCSDEKVVDVLQAINLILARSSFFVFLGMDTDMIYRAIDARYHAAQDDRAEFAESYLRKIVQLSFHLPTTAEDRRFALVSRMFSPAARQAFGSVGEPWPHKAEEDLQVEDAFEGGLFGAPGETPGLQITRSSQSVVLDSSPAPEVPRWSVADPNAVTGLGDIFRVDRSVLLSPHVSVIKEVEDTKEELDAFREFSLFMSPNPREIKRLVNVHRLVRILLVRPESPLSEPAQRKLVAWLIFSSRWRELVDDILRIAEQERPTDCMAALAGRQRDVALKAELLQFAEQLGEHGVITSDDLAEGRLLPEAARISQMVRDIPADALPGSPIGSDAATAPPEAAGLSESTAPTDVAARQSPGS